MGVISVKRQLRSTSEHDIGRAGGTDSIDNDSSVMPAPEEHFVDADAAARFLSLSRKHVLKLARLRRIPAYPITFGTRSVWRFRISELENWIIGQSAGTCDNRSGDSRKGCA
jgi:hypothetical protein